MAEAFELEIDFQYHGRHRLGFGQKAVGDIWD
jgi:hypothetical protein